MEEITMIKVTPEEVADIIKSKLVLELEAIMNRKEQPVQSNNDFITRKDTANFFQISLFTLHEWVKKGILKPYKAGNRTYFKKSELIEVLNSSNRGSSEE